MGKKRFSVIFIFDEIVGGREIYYGGIRKTLKESLKNLLRLCVDWYDRLEF